MRTIINFNSKWAFTKMAEAVPTEIDPKWEFVNLPHCWNNIDGQDGGNDYYRGKGYYAKSFKKAELPHADLYYIEFQGTNSSADVYLNGKKLAHHDGGYSTWRVNMTEAMDENNILAVVCDNSPCDTVYPQMADFTFYGGLYRDVNIICVEKTHFDLDNYGGPGIAVTPEICGKDANIRIDTYITNPKPDQKVRYTVYTASGSEQATAEGGTSVNIKLSDVHLWNARKDPYLYTVKAQIIEDGNLTDEISTRFGCRTYEIDPERGFILNGKEYPLRGVSRHQDRWGYGNALLPEHHQEDIDLICEIGANTVRLAHYQHSQYFYDLCDERGIVVWAEIPYISKHMPSGRENSISQMKELITQNYNHPSIVVWGLSNEITIGGSSEDLIENHRILNDLCHEMDKSRKTVVAAVSMCKMDDPYLRIPDAVCYNHYFGWYGGETDMNGPWFDKFHEINPDIPIGCSEYGCEALDWHTSEPMQGDYTEEYQAYYHEELIKQFLSRKYMWATYVWNMFDFGADARAEGGENGQNHKGLVTFDRKYKKDSFYAYKAWLSDEPFVHICGKRYIDRVEAVTRVTVYSNLPEIEMFADGVSLGKIKSDDHFFYFDVPNKGETELICVAGKFKDQSFIRKVENFNEAYRLRETGAILNWFDIEEPEGYFSLNDRIGDIMKTEQGKLLFGKFMTKLLGTKEVNTDKEKPIKIMDFEMTADMMNMMSKFTVMRAVNLAGNMMEGKITKEQLLDLNAQLNKIKKTK